MEIETEVVEEIKLKQVNNLDYNTDKYSLELKQYLEQIAVCENLREQLIKQIYLITSIQKAINNNTILNNINNLLLDYNESIASINGCIITSKDKISYFDIKQEIKTYNKDDFTLRLSVKCQEVENVFNQVMILNTQAIENAKSYLSLADNKTTNYSTNININNAILANNIV